MPNPPKLKRNAEICQAAASGAGSTELGRLHGVTPGRITAILKDAERWLA